MNKIRTTLNHNTAFKKHQKLMKTLINTIVVILIVIIIDSFK